MSHRRKRWPKGTWMKLKSANVLVAFMEQRDLSYARLARYSGCSKAFISHLVKGRKSTCTTDLAENIAEALGVPTLVLFEPKSSADSGRSNRSTRKVA